jgi:hypothetical protein
MNTRTNDGGTNAGEQNDAELEHDANGGTDDVAGAAGGGAEGGGDDDPDADTDADIAEAKRIGWVPPTEWKGKKPPKHGFMTAKEYIARGTQILPVMIDRNRTLNDKLDAQDKTNQELTAKLDEASKRLAEVGTTVMVLHKQNIEVGKRAYENARRDLIAERNQAVAEADTDKFARVQEKIDELDKNKPIDAPAAAAIDDTSKTSAERKAPPAADETSRIGQPKISEEAKAWAAANKWFNTSPMLNGAAIEIHDANLKSGMTEAESFETLTDQVKEAYPDRFENPARRQAAPVARPNGGRPGGGQPKKKAFADLPKESKDAFAAIKRHDPKYTEEQYLKDYQWD